MSFNIKRHIDTRLIFRWLSYHVLHIWVESLVFQPPQIVQVLFFHTLPQFNVWQTLQAPEAFLPQLCIIGHQKGQPFFGFFQKGQVRGRVHCQGLFTGAYFAQTHLQSLYHTSQSQYLCKQWWELACMHPASVRMLIFCMQVPVEADAIYWGPLLALHFFHLRPARLDFASRTPCQGLWPEIRCPCPKCTRLQMLSRPHCVFLREHRKYCAGNSTCHTLQPIRW